MKPQKTYTLATALERLASRFLAAETGGTPFEVQPEDFRNLMDAVYRVNDYSRLQNESNSDAVRATHRTRIATLEFASRVTQNSDLRSTDFGKYFADLAKSWAKRGGNDAE